MSPAGQESLYYRACRSSQVNTENKEGNLELKGEANQLSCEYTQNACISVYAWHGWTKGYCNFKFPSPVCTHSLERWLIESQHHSRSQNVVDEGFRRWQLKATWAKTAVIQTEILRSVVKKIQSIFPRQSKEEIRAIKFWIQTYTKPQTRSCFLLNRS